MLGILEAPKLETSPAAAMQQRWMHMWTECVDGESESKVIGIDKAEAQLMSICSIILPVTAAQTKMMPDCCLYYDIQIGILRF